MSTAKRETLVLRYLSANDGAIERTRTVAAGTGLMIPQAASVLAALERQGVVVRVARKGAGQFTALWRAA